MQQNFSLQVPLNSTSLGQTATCFLHELFLLELEPNIFPIGRGVDLSSYNGLLPDAFLPWLQYCIDKAQKSYKRSDPCLKWWHVHGAEEGVLSLNPYLMTFHEVDGLTEHETNILKNYEKVFVACEYNKNIFEQNGVNTVECNLGFDSLAFKRTDKKYYGDDITTIMVSGKLEMRKRHDKVLRVLGQMFGNNSAYKVHLHLYNHFLNSDPNKCKEINESLVRNYCGGDYFNFIQYPYFGSLQEVNESYNCADLVVDGSGGESWSLPSFHCVGLGKHAVLHNCTGIKSWATAANATLVEPSGKIPAIDGLFFKGEGSNFNVGNFYDFTDEDLKKAIESALEKVKKNKVNSEGLKIQEQFTWKKFSEKVLSNMNI